MNRSEIEQKMSDIPAAIIVNRNGVPYLNQRNATGAFFYLDPEYAKTALENYRKKEPAASLKIVTLADIYFDFVRGDNENLEGEFRVAPTDPNVRLANEWIEKI